MMIDMNSFVGHWPTHPVEGRAEEVWVQLRSVGVTRIFASPLDAVWCRNPHAYNAWICAAAETEDVWPVPVLDPMVADWRRELDRVLRQDRMKLVRLLPNYGGYALKDVDECLSAIAQAGLGALVQACMEDPRRQHPLAVVQNVPAAAVVDAAERHPDLKVMIGGAKAGELRALKGRILALPHVVADVSQVDGMDAVKILVDDGLGDRLVFGSHAPLMMPLASLGRFVPDLDDAGAQAILRDNALRFLGEG